MADPILAVECEHVAFGKRAVNVNIGKAGERNRTIAAAARASRRMRDPLLGSGMPREHVAVVERRVNVNVRECDKLAAVADRLREISNISVTLG